MTWHPETAAYEFGGSLSADSPTYVVRSVDDELFIAIRSGMLCYILNARQMGKSSLRVRTMERLRSIGIACVDVDLSLIGARGASAEEWYAGVVDSLASRLGFPGDLELASWWQRQAPLSPVMRLARFFEEMTAIREESNIVIFFDEIDALLGLDYGDDFFSLLRSWHERGASQAEARRLTFVLVGVATPIELIKDPRRSPFNIGRAIHLNGFKFDEAQSALLPGLASKFSDPETILQQILFWTGGQPFLTQKLCSIAMASTSRPASGTEEAWVKELVYSRVIDQWESQDDPVHLRTIRDHLLESNGRRTGRLLGLYQRVLEAQAIPSQESLEQIELRLSGLVIERAGNIKVANPIYAAIFGLEWIRLQLAELRPYAAAIAIWQASGRLDTSSLLTGEALLSARGWAADKSLGDEDYQFLEASGELERKNIQTALEKANLLVRQAETRSSRLKRIGLLSLMMTFALSFTVLKFSWSTLAASQRDLVISQERVSESERQVEAMAIRLSHQQEVSLRLQSLTKELESKRQSLEASIPKLRIQGEVASFVASIAQDPAVLRPAEMEVFWRLSRSSDETRRAFLQEALTSANTATRIESRSELATQALVGISADFRSRLLRESLLPCLRQASRPIEARRLCIEIIRELDGVNQETADPVHKVVEDMLGSSQDLREIDVLTSVLPSLARVVPTHQALEIFYQLMAASEKAVQISAKTGSRADVFSLYVYSESGVVLSGFKADLIRRLAEIAATLPLKDREHASEAVLSAIRQTTETKSFSESSRQRFWVDTFSAIAGDLSPTLREEAFATLIPANYWQLAKLIAKVEPEDAAAAFSQLITLSTKYHFTASDASINDLVSKMRTEEAGAMLQQVLRQYLEPETSQKNANPFFLLAAVRAMAARAQPAEVAQAFEMVMAHRGDATALQKGDSAVRWAKALQTLPTSFAPGQAKWLLPKLIALIEIYSRRDKGHLGFPGQEDALEEALVAVAAKSPPRRSVHLLTKALVKAESPGALRPLVRALGLFPGELDSEEAKLVIAKVLGNFWENGDIEKIKFALRSIASHVRPSTAQDIAGQVLASIEMPKKDPWSEALAKPVRNNLYYPQNPFLGIQQSYPSQFDRHWEVDERKLLLAAEILSSLPQGDVTASAGRVLWPVIKGALMCDEPPMQSVPGGGSVLIQPQVMRLISNGKVLKSYGPIDCGLLAAAVRLLPGELAPAVVGDMTNAIGTHFICNRWDQDIFGASVSKVPRAGVQEVTRDILQKMEAQPEIGSMNCLLAGFAAQKDDLSIEQLRRIFTILKSQKSASDTPYPWSLNGGYASESSNLLGSSWVQVAERINSREACQFLEFLVSRLVLSPNSVERKMAAEALPGLAKKVLPEEVPQAFNSLIQDTAKIADVSINKTLADSIAALPPKIPLRALIDFLSQPQCVGPLRKAAISHLERLAGKSFDGSLWAALNWARGRGAYAQ